jgi:hypothetical protein
MKRLGVLALTILTACTAGVEPGGEPTSTADGSTTSSAVGDAGTSTTTSTVPAPDPTLPPAPETQSGPLDPLAEEGLRSFLDGIFADDFDPAPLDLVIESEDVRAGWILADLMRFYQRGDPRDVLVSAFRELTGYEGTGTGEIDFVWAFNALMAWDLPAWDGYSDMKASIYTRVDPRWRVFFEQDVGVDWRWVTWGGVGADDRPLGDNGPCNCIPSLDEPATTGASGGDWYDDDRIVFGIQINGESLALPKHQMEIHEMVNLTLGGRDIGVPYCTLCGSAQAYFTDNVAGFDRVVLRTSGLLSRSNKMMYDLTTNSLIDTFTGEATTGPLAEAGVVLDQTTVVAATWGDWKEAHPDTRILAEDGGIDRVYPDDPLRGRDDDGPIFPIGDVDPRLPVQENVVGVVTGEGAAIAFPVEAVEDVYQTGDEFTFEDLIVRLSDGIRVFDTDGNELPTHQAFWFAWSQFHPTTLVWSPQGG